MRRHRTGSPHVTDKPARSGAIDQDLVQQGNDIPTNTDEPKLMLVSDVFHGFLPDSATRFRFTKSSFNVSPRPGRSGTVIKPSGPAWNFSSVSSCRIGESSTQSSKMNASRHVLSQWSDAA